MKSKVTPRALAEAAGIMELPVTEPGTVGRGAVLNVFDFIILRVCWRDVGVRRSALDAITLKCI